MTRASRKAREGLEHDIDTAEEAGAGGCDPLLPLTAGPYGRAWWATLLGYDGDELPPADALRRWLGAKIHPDDVPRLQQAYADFSAERVPDFAVAVRVRHKGGTWTVVQGRFRATARDAEGRKNRLVGVLLDVTEQQRTEARIRAERRKAEAALQESQAKARAIMDIALDAVITIDTRGVIESVNPAAERIFGYTSDEMIGQNVRMLMPPPFREKHDQYIQRYLATGQKKVIGIGRTVVAQRKDGSTFPIDLALIEVPLGDRSLFTSIIRDVSERLRLEREVLHISTEERQRLGRDLHDGLGSMLTGVAMGAQGLAQARKRGQPVDPEDLERLAQMAEEGAEQARALAHGLNPVKLDREGLPAALQEFVATTRTLTRIACSFEADDPLPNLNGLVVTQLYWIAQEALNNAVKHAGARHITVRLAVEEDDLLLTVRDDGTGLAGRSKSRRGTGIHIMHYRANLIGAAFSISKAQGRGTHVSCRLPLDQAAASSSIQGDRSR